MCDFSVMPRSSVLIAIFALALASAHAAVPVQWPSERLATYRLVSSTQAPADPHEWDKLSPEQRMQRRFPQPVKAGFLIGLPVLDYEDFTLGHVRKVVRTAENKILLIVAYGRWFTWSKRPVAVPIETVAILGRQINALEMLPEDFDKAPTWNDAGGQGIAVDATIQIAISKR
jgi:hypothetical protein